MDVVVVAEAVRGMSDDTLGELVGKLPSTAFPVLMRALPDEAIFALIGSLPDGSGAKQTVALAIGHSALRRAAEAPPAPPAPRGRGRPRKTAVTEGTPTPPARRPRAVKGTGAGGRVPGAKRSPQALAQLTEKTFLTIKANPGIRMEALRKALDVETRELSLPIKKLIADKKIKSSGQKRATEYTAK